MLKHLLSPICLLLLLALNLSPPATAAPNDDDQNGHDLEIKITAPVESVDLQASPQKVQVLGLSIQIAPGVVVGSDGENESGEHEKDATAGLVVGRFFEFTLKSNDAPLTAIKIDEAGDNDGIQIKAALQAVDSAAQTIQILGLTVSTAKALITGENEDSAVTLTTGQVIEVQLDQQAYSATLSATKISIENTLTGLLIEIDEHDGNNNEDGDNEHDGENNDVNEVEVVETVRLRDGTARSTKVTRQLHFTAQGKSLRCTGLSPGKAKVTIKRHGKSVTKSVTIRRSVQQAIRIRFR